MSDETTRKPDDPRPDDGAAQDPTPETAAPETAAPEPGPGTATGAPVPPVAPATPETRSGGAAPPAGGGPPALPARYGGAPGGGHGDGEIPYKPSKVTTMAVIDLVDGVVNVLIGLGWVFGGLLFGLGTWGCGCFVIPLGAYPLILGVLEIVYASQLLPARPRNVGVARWLAVMQIIAVLYGQIISVVAGVLKLVFAEDPEVRDYLERTRTAPPAAPGGYGA